MAYFYSDAVRAIRIVKTQHKVTAGRCRAILVPLVFCGIKRAKIIWITSQNANQHGLSIYESLLILEIVRVIFLPFPPVNPFTFSGGRRFRRTSLSASVR